jgi:hypothetical protein
MISDKDLNLETDRLDEVLEAPNPAQPVVVVQYGRRGIPSWVLVLLMLLVPCGAMYAYQRVVVERYRAQLLQTRQALESWAARHPEGAAPQTKTDFVNTPAPKPLVVTLAPPAAAQPDAGSTSTPIRAAGIEKSANSVAGDPTATAPVAPPNGPADSAKVSERTGDKPAELSHHAEKPVAAQGQTGDTVASQVVAPAAPIDPAPASDEKPTKVTMRSILPNPFANGEKAPKSPEPNGPPASAAETGPGTNAQPPRGDALADASRKNPSHGPIAHEPPALPSKEETLREIEEEAAKKQADIVAQLESKQAELRSQRIEEQVRFREELYELIRTHGTRAGPEIDALAKRYAYGGDPDRYGRAYRFWRYSRRSQREKVELVRSLELPETVILDFISDDLNERVRTRDGPRNASEARVLAAKQLLRYVFPDGNLAPRSSASPAPVRGQSQQSGAVARPR